MVPFCQIKAAAMVSVGVQEGLAEEEVQKHHVAAVVAVALEVRKQRGTEVSALADLVSAAAQERAPVAQWAVALLAPSVLVLAVGAEEAPMDFVKRSQTAIARGVLAQVVVEAPVVAALSPLPELRDAD